MSGDPLMHVWSTEPAPLLMTYNSSEEGGVYKVDVTVLDKDNNAVPNAVVTLWVEDTYYLTVRTSAYGRCRFKQLQPFSAGYLTAWKHNYVPVTADGVVVGE